MSKINDYMAFLEGKIIQTPATGFTVAKESLHPLLKPHQKDIVAWALEGGCRAIFASFGLGKTFMQLEIANQVCFHTNRPFLIGLPLGVKQEFFEDARALGISIAYAKEQAEVEYTWHENGISIFVSNYERIREGKFNAGYFGGVSFDEGDAIRNLDTETTDYIMNHFSVVKHRFIATATPSPNDYTEILNYAQFLGIMDRAQALTRFFQRNSTTAGDLTLYPHKEKEFWYWLRSWSVIIEKPSDLGYSDEGYTMPPMKVEYRMVTLNNRSDIRDRDNNPKMFRDASAGLVEAAKEKRESLPERIDEVMTIISEHPDDHFIIWHDLDDEYKQLRKRLPGVQVVHGGQPMDEREKSVMGFKNGEFKYMATKPRISGSGCNFQKHCHRAIFMGIGYKFKEFIQAIHRIYRYLQTEEVVIYIIYSDAEEHVLKTLFEKWNRHNEMVAQMTGMIKQYGMSGAALVSDLKRSLHVVRKEASGDHWKCIRNDAVIETQNMPGNSVGMILSSIPFSDQYEYCESYHDMGHNDGNGDFFRQLDFLTPELFRILQPGRVACIHVKDRIQFSYQNGVGFTSLIDFAGETVAHFKKHGFFLLGKHFIATDVVRENASTYRLGWSEQCKDGTKMGSGSPEYLLVFRKPPTDGSNAYADVPVFKQKDEYSRARWQLDAHAFWKTSGDRLFNPDELRKMDLGIIGKLWLQYDLTHNYDHERHVELCEKLDKLGKLPSGFMAVPPRSENEWIWDDVNRMNTLNTQQSTRRNEKHVCPLQFDIIDRAIGRYSNKGDVVFDPFGGIMSVVFRCIKMERYGLATELFEQYWRDGVQYCKEADYKRSVPTLFDMLGKLPAR